MKKRELKAKVKELQENKYLDLDVFVEKTKAFISQAKKEHDMHAMGYGKYFLVLVEFRKNTIDEGSAKKLLYSLRVAEEFGDSFLEVEARNLFGIVSTYIYDMMAALEQYEVAYSIAKKHHYYGELAGLANNIGDIYLQMEEYDKANTYFMEALKLATDNMSKDGNYNSVNYNARIGLCLMNISEINFRKGNLEEALRLIERAELGIDKTNPPYFYTSFLSVKTLLYIKMGRVSEIRDYVEKVIEDSANNVEVIMSYTDYAKLTDALIDEGLIDYAERLLLSVKNNAELMDTVDRWCDYYKIAVKFERVFHPNKDVTSLYDSYFACKEKQERKNREQQIKAVKNKQLLEAEVHKRYSMELRNRMLKAKSEHDQLTGLFNRYTFVGMGQQWFNEAKRKNSVVCMMLLDIDFFKEFNDTYGHLEGDNALKLVSKALMECADKDDLVMRYGGDEFFILSKGKTKREIFELAKAIDSKIKEVGLRHEKNEVSDCLTLSFGAVRGKVADDQLIFDFVHMADTGLYKVKNEKRNALGLYNQSGNEFEYERMNF